MLDSILNLAGHPSELLQLLEGKAIREIVCDAQRLGRLAFTAEGLGSAKQSRIVRQSLFGSSISQHSEDRYWSMGMFHHLEETI